jgi:hypothetical protein
MLADEKFNQILDAISHQATTSLLFLSRRIPPFGSGGEYLQGRCASVTRPYGPIVYLRSREPAPPVR